MPIQRVSQDTPASTKMQAPSSSQTKEFSSSLQRKDNSGGPPPSGGDMMPRGKSASGTEMTDDQRLFLNVATNGTFGSGGGLSVIRPGDLSPVDTFRGHLAVAIKNGDTQAVEDMLKAPPQGFDINGALGDAGATALHDAVAAGAGDIVRFLVDQKGGDMAKLDDGGKSAYQAADDKAKKTNDPKDRDTADYLRGRMTDELKRAALDGNYNRADELIKAGADGSILPGGQLGTREQFIDAGANFSYFLRDAITKGDTQGVMALLKDPPKGWDINAIGTAFGPAGSDGNSTLLQYVAHATNANNEGTIRALIDQGGVDLAKLDQSGKSAFQSLDEYAKAIHDPAAQRSADFMRDKMNGELGTAVFNGDQSRAVALLKAGADPKAAINGDPEKSKGFTLLMFAAANKEPEVVKAALDALPSDERKDFVNQKDSGGGTALHAAAFGGDDATYKMLVKAGGDETVKDDQGQTPKDVSGELKKRGTDEASWLGAVPVVGQAYLLWRLHAHGGAEYGAMQPRPIDPADPGANLPPAGQQFLANPVQYAAQNFIGVAAAHPAANGTPVNNGDTVSFTVDPVAPGTHAPGQPELGGNAPAAVINAHPVENPGPNTATWLTYNQRADQQTDTWVNVPAHPTGNQARFVMTPALTGCAFYVTANPDDPSGNTVRFHHVSGPTDATNHPNQNPTVPSDGRGIGYNDYGRGPNGAAQGAGPAANGITPYAHYDDATHQWVIQGQPFSLPAQSNPPTATPFKPGGSNGGLGGFTVPGNVPGLAPPPAPPH